MKINKESKEHWHNFYSNAWDIRMKIAQKIIDDGERSPFRVLKVFNSMMRMSNQLEFHEKDGSFSFNADDKYSEDDIVNISIVNNSLSLQPMDKYPFGQDTKKVRVFENDFYNASYYSNFNVENFLLDYVRNKNFDAIIELGSGYSNNLINLHGIGGPKVPYFGGEYTKEGTEFAQMLSDLDEDLDLTPFRFDYTDPDLSIITDKFENPFIFTCHSIEQVEFIPEDLLEKISLIAPKVTCMHIEPFGYQFNIDNPTEKVDEMQRQMFFGKHWNKNLLNVLINSSLNKKIDLVYMQKNIIGGNDPFNPASLALWKKIN